MNLLLKLDNYKMFSKWFLLFSVIVFFTGCGVSADTIAMDNCCNTGIEWAKKGQNCTQFVGRVENVPIELQSICVPTVEICCLRQYRYQQCGLGLGAAQDGKLCEHNETVGSEYYTDCCEGCKIGIIMGSSGDDCNTTPFSFGVPWDDALEHCCKTIKHSGGIQTFELPPDGKFCSLNADGRFCEQICVDADNDSYYCECESGYILRDDQTTCQKIDDDDEDNKNQDISQVENCSNGFHRDKKSGECVDIDECEMMTANCNRLTEMCVNTNGSYECVKIGVTSVTCDDGYRYNTKTEECEDIHECNEDIHTCNRDTQICINTLGGYRCTNKPREPCFPGLEYNTILKRCEDIDECQNRTICAQGFMCVNKLGSYDCVSTVNNIIQTSSGRDRLLCREGYQRQNNNCVDINECLVNKNSCTSHENCINFSGGFKCECKLGFQLDPLKKTCVDINECQINNHECLETQRCDNTVGSYICIRLQGCGTGYTLNAATGQCDDDDECALQTHNCGQNYECRNTNGSFRCNRPRPTYATTTTTPRPQVTNPVKRVSNYSLQWARPNAQCDTGFIRNNHGACMDINECQHYNKPCRHNQRCVNTNGSYRCENLLNCPGGYTANEDGSQCTDIDECQTKEANCGPNQLCRNKPGGYICTCPPGHVLNSEKRCEDINECEYYLEQVCPVNTNCINTVGSYQCECNPGFRKHRGEDKSCVDIDECSETSGLCQQKCINYWGSYRCACQSGYQLSVDNRTCDDINECEVHKTYNLCMGICQNVPGSYQCTCPDGYRLGADGRTCQDIDECETNTCRGHNEICTNTRGGYRCTKIDCPPDYVIDSDKKNRCKRISLVCEIEDNECLRKPTAYSYNFITLVSNMSIPPQGRGLFNFKGPNWFDNIDFDYHIAHVSAPPNVQKADEYFFAMQKINNEALLSLMRTLEGPQDIEIELSMTVYRNQQPSGTNIAKIFIIVSEHTY